MEEFMRVRAEIDSLIDGAKLSIQSKSLSESMEQLEKARVLIQELKRIAASEQDYIVAKREVAIAHLAINAGKIKKQPVRKSTAKEILVLPSVI